MQESRLPEISPLIRIAALWGFLILSSSRLTSSDILGLLMWQQMLCFSGATAKVEAVLKWNVKPRGWWSVRGKSHGTVISQPEQGRVGNAPVSPHPQLHSRGILILTVIAETVRASGSRWWQRSRADEAEALRPDRPAVHPSSDRRAWPLRPCEGHSASAPPVPCLQSEVTAERAGSSNTFIGVKPLQWSGTYDSLDESERSLSPLSSSVIIVLAPWCGEGITKHDTEPRSQTPEFGYLH